MTKDTESKKKRTDWYYFKIFIFCMVVATTVFWAVLTLAKNVVNNDEEVVEEFDENGAWLDANDTLLESGQDCEIFKASGVVRTYEPKKVSLRVVGYGENYYHRIEIPRTVNVSFLEKEPRTEKFVKACFSKEGYVSTVEEYSLKEKSTTKENSK